MGDVINLRRVRKARERTAEAAAAEENRVRFGRPKRARTLAETRAAIEAVRHEGHRLEGRDQE